MKRTFLAFVAAALAVTLVPLSVSAQTIYLDERFEDGVDVFNSSAWGMLELDQGHQGSGIRSVINTGDHWGSSGWWIFPENGFNEPEELYWRYWLRFGEDFYIAPPARGKLPGPSSLSRHGDGCMGGVGSTVSKPCFSVRMLFSKAYPTPNEPGYPNSPDDKTRIGFYAYHLGKAGDIQPWDLETAMLDHGQWYCVEGRIKLNTPGQSDGVLQGWVDGQQAYSRSNFKFRRSNESALDIKSFWWDIYYGGKPTSPVRNEIQFDSLALASERIGCSESYEGSFFDDDYSIFQNDIEWMAENGITNGCNPPANNMYCPSDPVTRDVMAVYISRALHLPASPIDYFDDDDGSQFESDINRLAHAGVTKGCGDRQYCPGDVVDRGQMAAFLARALGLTDDGGGDLFLDDDSSIFRKDIDRLAAAGVTRGCNPPTNDRYCPGDKVDRGAMAAFLHRALGDS